MSAARKNEAGWRRGLNYSGREILRNLESHRVEVYPRPATIYAPQYASAKIQPMPAGNFAAYRPRRRDRWPGGQEIYRSICRGLQARSVLASHPWTLSLTQTSPNSNRPE